LANKNCVPFGTHFFNILTQNISMRKRDKDYEQVLNKLTYAEPSEVGGILKEYFHLKKVKSKKK
jgi:hypothetical protein